MAPPKRSRTLIGLSDCICGLGEAREPRLIPLYPVVFAAMTALWHFAGHRLARNHVVGTQLRRYGHVTLPIVLGLWILFGARVLFQSPSCETGSKPAGA